MRELHFKMLFILAVNQPNENADKAFLAEHGIHVSNPACIGAYKGKLELAYLIPCDQDTRAEVEASVLQAAKAANQESVLFLDSEREAYLIFVDNRDTGHIGTWSGIDSAEAASLDAWTLNRETGQYYTVR